MTKKILIIASEFPPRAGGNMLRTVKLVKHLPSFGWKSYVLTVSLNSIPKFDYSLMAEIPKEAQIIRAFYPNIFKPLDKRWHQKQGLRRHSVTGSLGQSNPSACRLSSVGCGLTTSQPVNEPDQAHNSINPINLVNQGTGNLANKPNYPITQLPNYLKTAVLWLIWFIRRQLLIPSELVLWLPFAVFKGVWICRKEKIDLIYSTAPSYINHLVGLLIKLLTKKGWMADYRDLWTDYPTRKMSSKFHKKLEERLETSVLKNADAVNIVSPLWRESLLKNFPFLSSDKVTCYTNGYDPEDFNQLNRPNELNKPKALDQTSRTSAAIEQIQHNDAITQLPNDANPVSCELSAMRFNISYVGTILNHYPTPLFLRAFGELCQEIPEIREKARVNFYGDIRDGQRLEINRMVEKFSLQRNVALNGTVPRQKALKIMENSDLLLLMYIHEGANVDGCIPGKIFEYIGAQKPIFAMVPKNGSAAEIIKKGNLGLIASPNSYEEIKDVLNHLYLSWESPKFSNDVITRSPNDPSFASCQLSPMSHELSATSYNPNWNYLRQFDRKYIVGKLVEIFDKICER